MRSALLILFAFAALISCASAARSPKASKTAKTAELAQVKDSLSVLFDTLINEFFGSFLPALSRVRRDTRNRNGGGGNGSVNGGGPPPADYLDTIMTGMGALMDRQNCRLRVTCNAGKMIQSNVPGSQMAVMLLESFVPEEWLPWYATVKTAVIDRSDNCSEDYSCDLLPEEPHSGPARGRGDRQQRP